MESVGYALPPRIILWGCYLQSLNVINLLKCGFDIFILFRHLFFSFFRWLLFHSTFYWWLVEKKLLFVWPIACRPDFYANYSTIFSVRMWWHDRRLPIHLNRVPFRFSSNQVYSTKTYCLAYCTSKFDSFYPA